MNEFLAELYGTREAIGAEDSSDVEKLAEAQILDNVLQSEGIDVDQLDDGTILKLAYEIFGDDSELVKSAMEDEGDGESAKKCEDCGKVDCECDTAEKNASDADIMGRIMAHSMVNELNDIEKNAGVKDKVFRALASAAKGTGLKEGLKSIKSGKSALSTGKSLQKGIKGKPAFGAAGEATRAELKSGKGLQGLGKKQISAGRKAALKGAAGTAALYGGGAAATGGAGYALGKEGSALDTLAEQRALEFLAENGIEVGGGETKLASAIEERAYEMLVEAGYLE